MYINAFQNNFALWSLQKRVSGSNAYKIAPFSAFQKGVLTPPPPPIQNSFAFIICKFLILRQKGDDKRTLNRLFIFNPILVFFVDVNEELQMNVVDEKITVIVLSYCHHLGK